MQGNGYPVTNYALLVDLGQYIWVDLFGLVGWCTVTVTTPDR